MTALDVLASRRKVIEAEIARRKSRLEQDTNDLVRVRESLDSIIEAQGILTNAGFTREWADDELTRMRFYDRPE